jgi:hypothetical protein
MQYRLQLAVSLRSYLRAASGVKRRASGVMRLAVGV